MGSTTHGSDDDELERILLVTTPDDGTAAHTVRDPAEAMFTWGYERSRPGLSKLYERAKSSQWNGTTDLDWSVDVDVERVATELASTSTRRAFYERLARKDGTPISGWGDRELLAYEIERLQWTLSQFLHGEQGALLCTAKIVETVPWVDAKYYAATQVIDEARHVEVFGRYLDEKLEGHYPVNAHLGALLDDIIADSRWDMTYLGMQIMVEGLALAAFGAMQKACGEPLLQRLLRYVMSDEARHVAFGVLSLQELYGELSAAELRERQEFAFEATLRMRDRFLQQEVWERMGVDVRGMMRAQLAEPFETNEFQRLLFSKVVPNCKKLGLLDAGDRWLRVKFTEIGIIDFEDGTDTAAEYELLDEVARDRADQVA